MRLKLQLSRPTGSVSDIVVTTDSGATVSEVAATIVTRDPVGPGSATESPTLAVTFPGETSTTVLPSDATISDAAIASGARVSIVDGTAVHRQQGAVLALVRVVQGPDAGREFQLRRGATVIGRDPSADIVLSDPLISKRHARIEVTTVVTLVDLNSANGLVVDGGQVTRVALPPSGTVTLGDTVLRIDVVAALNEPGTGRSGTVQFNRSPRVEKRYPGEEYDGPEIPNENDPIPFPWLSLLAPAAMGVAFIFLPGVSSFRFLFIALAPIIMIGTFFTQRMQNRRKHKRDVEKFTTQLDYLASTLSSEREIEREVRLAEAPPTEEVVQHAHNQGPMLWTRRPEHWSFLNVRLGVGTAPSRNSVRGVNSRNGIPEYIEKFREVVESYRLVEGVPIVENLNAAGALGFAGSPTETAEATHAVLAQIAGLYSPSEVAFAGIMSPAWAAHFGWLKWLPHTSSPHTPLQATQLADSVVTGQTLLLALEELIAHRTASLTGPRTQNRGPVEVDDAYMAKGAKVGEKALDDEADEPPALPSIVLVISDDAPVERARLVDVVERAAAAGIYPIWLSESVEQLPAACRTFVSVEPSPAGADPAVASGVVGLVRVGEEYVVTSSRMTTAAAFEFALSLAGVNDASAYVADQSDMPRSVSLVSLLGPEMLEVSDAVIDRWTQNDSIHDRTPGAAFRPRRSGRLRAIVGQGTVDAMHLDLRTMGPHALVGGTTGSGKSEFLQAWVLGMAAEYSPDRVTFLFVDYKGGSAFADCVHLPHTVGLVTDLSVHLVRRALTSLRAELQYREHLFNRKKVKDLIELEKRGDPECPPALVLVIDEFAALVGEVPEFVDGVVDVAQRGRSLGIHLIMATQRPAGVIKDNLRANTPLRIALRMADAHDSVDVVGSSVAAGFDPAIPGRGVVKSGPTRVDAFQTGYAGGWTSSVKSKPSIEVADLAFGHETPWANPNPEVELFDADLGPNDTARLVSTITVAAKEAGIPTPRKPWLDELSSVYDLALLRQRTDAELVLGVVDDPTRQQQYPVYFRPDTDGNLAIYGTGGSGKSVLLRTLAVASGITPRGGPVQVYGIDFSSGGLRALESMPHVGSIIQGDDSERIVRLMRMLRATVDERVQRYGAVRASTVAEYRTLANRPDEPRILLLIDGMATFRQEYEFTGTANVFPMFQQLLSDGRGVGVHVILTADRPASVSPTIAASIQRRVALRLAEDNDYLLLDNASDVLNASSPPGRGIIDRLELQVAVFGGTSNVAEQSAAIDRLAATMREKGVQEAPEIRRLPEMVYRSELAPAQEGEAVIGMADDTLASIGVTPEGAFLLAGPPSSGRSTALLSLAQATHAAVPGMRLVYFGNAKSPLRSWEHWSDTAAGIEEVSALAKSLLADAQQTTQRLGIVIEAIGDYVSTPADADLVALMKAAKRNDHFVIAEGETSTLMPSWPLLMEVKSARRGFALQPDPQEGDILFRTSYPRAKRSEFPPGRGWLVQAGKVRRVQLALPD